MSFLPLLLLWLSSKESACQCGAAGSIPGLGRSPRRGNGNPLQYFCLESPVDRGTWWAIVHGVTKSRILLSDWGHTHTFMCEWEHLSWIFIFFYSFSPFSVLWFHNYVIQWYLDFRESVILAVQTFTPWRYYLLIFSTSHKQQSTFQFSVNTPRQENPLSVVGCIHWWEGEQHPNFSLK